VQYHTRHSQPSQKTQTIMTSQRSNVFLNLVKKLSGAPTSDSESPYPYTNTPFERKHGDEIGTTESPASPNAMPIKFTLEPASGVPNTIMVKIQSPKNEPLVLKYGRADGHHHPKSTEVTKETFFIDGLPEGQYVFIMGYPSISAGTHTINLNDPITRLDYDSTRPVDHKLTQTAPSVKRIHRVGGMKRA
jgi:hypothetical protein